MFQCPLCRQVANLTASVSVEDLTKPPKPRAETGSIMSYGTANVMSANRLPSVKSSGALSAETNADNLATSPTMPVDGPSNGTGAYGASNTHRRQFSNGSSSNNINGNTNGNSPGGAGNGENNAHASNKDKTKKTFSQKLSTFFNKAGRSNNGSAVGANANAGGAVAPYNPGNGTNASSGGIVAARSPNDSAQSVPLNGGDQQQPADNQNATEPAT
jgi:hypothetical protein